MRVKAEQEVTRLIDGDDGEEVGWVAWCGM